MQSIPRLSSTSINNEHLQTRASLGGWRRHRPARSSLQEALRLLGPSASPLPSSPRQKKPLLLTFIKATALLSVTKTRLCWRWRQRWRQRAPEARWQETDAWICDSSMWCDENQTVCVNWPQEGWLSNKKMMLLLLFVLEIKNDCSLNISFQLFIQELLCLYFWPQSYKPFENTGIYIFRIKTVQCIVIVYIVQLQRYHSTETP